MRPGLPLPVEPVDTGPQARAVGCRGHAFDEHLMCRCGKSWWAHQRLPTRCPQNAHGQNRRHQVLDPEELGEAEVS